MKFIYHYYANNVRQEIVYADGTVENLAVDARTTMKLFTGGRAGVNRQSLICVSASATEYGRQGDWAESSVTPWLGVPESGVSASSIRVLGKNLGADGNLWLTLPDNASPDLFIAAPPRHYNATASVQKYELTMTANYNDITTNTPEFCVGQQVFLWAKWIPSLPEEPTRSPIKWTLGGKYIDNYYQPSPSTQSIVYTNDPSFLTNEYATLWWVSGDCDNPPTYITDLAEGLTFANGQYAAVAANGKIKMYRPKIVSFSPSTSTAVVLDTNDPSNIYLGLGQGSKQMYWDMGVKAKATYRGTLSNVQLYSGYSQFDTTFNPDTYGDYWLDNADPYPGEQQFAVGNYSPPITLIFHQDPPHIEGNFTSLAEDMGDFITYVRFQPDGGIPITIGSVIWYYHGKATTDGSGAWSLDTQTVSWPICNYDDDTFPEWPNTFYNSH